MPQDYGHRKGADIMLAELRQKAQITIPKEIIVKLGLSEGDKLDVFEKDGMEGSDFLFSMLLM